MHGLVVKGTCLCKGPGVEGWLTDGLPDNRSISARSMAFNCSNRYSLASRRACNAALMISTSVAHASNADSSSSVNALEVGGVLTSVLALRDLVSCTLTSRRSSVAAFCTCTLDGTRKKAIPEKVVGPNTCDAVL